MASTLFFSTSILVVKIKSKLEKMPDKEWLKNLKDKNVLLYDEVIDVEAHH